MHADIVKIIKTSQWRRAASRTSFRPNKENATRLAKETKGKVYSIINTALSRHFDSSVSHIYTRRNGEAPIDPVSIGLTVANAKKLGPFRTLRGKTTAIINRALDTFYAQKTKISNH